MSEKIQSNDPVVIALKLEKEIAQSLQIPADDKARQEVRGKMEEWMKIMNSPKTRKLYAEELGELDPKRAQFEMLVSIKERFPKVAKDLGWDEKAAAEYQQETA